jgi:hypothetical protein
MRVELPFDPYDANSRKALVELLDILRASPNPDEITLVVVPSP